MFEYSYGSLKKLLGESKVTSMDMNQWIEDISNAYKIMGKTLSPDKRVILLSSDEPETMNPDIERITKEFFEVMNGYFFKKATHGETFGSLSRIKKRFGKSLEENYGLSTGIFINMAKTYWTYKLEVDDLFLSEYSDVTLYKLLSEFESYIASIFFPMPGSLYSIPVSQRREAQHQLLQKYAPEIDIEKFLSESPILKGRKGCLGTIILMISILFLLLSSLWILFS